MDRRSRHSRAVRGNGHWDVPSTIKRKPQAEVKTEDGQILLYSTDLLVTTARRYEGDKPHIGFSVPAHEFGHTFGGRNDEWRPGQPHNKDRESIMNIGRTLRAPAPVTPDLHRDLVLGEVLADLSG